MRAPRGAAIVLFVGASLTPVAAAPPTLAFGSINGIGQHAEHERNTRSLSTVFQPGTLDVLAGTRGYLGAVGQPDKLSVDPQFPPSDPEGLGPGKKHCDGGDFLPIADILKRANKPTLHCRSASPTTRSYWIKQWSSLAGLSTRTW